MFPRVAFEYGHTLCAFSTSSAACAASSIARQRHVQRDRQVEAALRVGAQRRPWSPPTRRRPPPSRAARPPGPRTRSRTRSRRRTAARGSCRRPGRPSPPAAADPPRARRRWCARDPRRGRRSRSPRPCTELSPWRQPTPRAPPAPACSRSGRNGISARLTYSAPPATTALRTGAGGSGRKPYSRRMRSGSSAMVMKLAVCSSGWATHGIGGSSTISRARRRAQSVTRSASPSSISRR